jgi:hypothetical protein
MLGALHVGVGREPHGDRCRDRERLAGIERRVIACRRAESLLVSALFADRDRVRGRAIRQDVPFSISAAIPMYGIAASERAS